METTAVIVLFLFEDNDNKKKRTPPFPRERRDEMHLFELFSSVINSHFCPFSIICTDHSAERGPRK